MRRSNTSSEMQASPIVLLFGCGSNAVPGAGSLIQSVEATCLVLRVAHCIDGNRCLFREVSDAITAKIAAKAMGFWVKMSRLSSCYSHRYLYRERRREAASCLFPLRNL